MRSIVGGPYAGELESLVDRSYSVSVNISGLCLKVLLGNWLPSKPYNSKMNTGVALTIQD